MAGVENVVTARYVKELVEEQGKTHKEVADILKTTASRGEWAI